ncbi:sigma factor-like helix-turn-helix DNA-binding protein [Nonomuraea jabiensis]|uniref:sigma factor-like helix-turn-helix DNA-binding protein n=1 Tax=Nonomuraea jabiensis TaxID=882448 RepID=UPI003445E522
MWRKTQIIRAPITPAPWAAALAAAAYPTWDVHQAEYGAYVRGCVGLFGGYGFGLAKLASPLLGGAYDLAGLAVQWGVPAILVRRPWLPETTDLSAGPETSAERREAVDTAIRLLLERLTPAERAVYLLRIAFDYPYRQISEILHLGEDHARQLLRRARDHLATERRHQVSTAAHRRLVRTFVAAAQPGDLAGLEELLAADVAR